MKTQKSLVFRTAAIGQTTEPQAMNTSSSPLFIPSMAEEDEENTKHKPTLVAHYKGFNIWGKKLMLSVSPKDTSSVPAAQRSQERQIMDNWVSATQQPPADPE
jgi:hypothetical protein